MASIVKTKDKKWLKLLITRERSSS